MRKCESEGVNLFERISSSESVSANQFQRISRSESVPVNLNKGIQKTEYTKLYCGFNSLTDSN